MKLQKFVERLEIKPLSEDNINTDIEVRGCYIGDLLSNVMANAKKGEIWLTVQTHTNVVAVAHLLDLAGVILLEGRQPGEDTLEKARKEGIPLFSIDKRAYEAACLLYDCGLGRLEP